jgi:hypothetical protein
VNEYAIAVWWTLVILSLLAFASKIGFDAGERAERRRLGRPEFQEHWGADEEIGGNIRGD